jgi:alanine-synthesizing transaminase
MPRSHLAGAAFGENGEGYFRIALVENEQRLRQAIRNISRYLQESRSASQGRQVAG